MASADETFAQLGRMLREERQQRHLTQQGFADLLGISRTYLSELESGKATLHLRRLLSALNAVGIDLVPRRRGR